MTVAWGLLHPVVPEPTSCIRRQLRQPAYLLLPKCDTQLASTKLYAFLALDQRQRGVNQPNAYAKSRSLTQPRTAYRVAVGSPYFPPTIKTAT